MMNHMTPAPTAVRVPRMMPAFRANTSCSQADKTSFSHDETENGYFPADFIQ
jgi:hypothetical protein